MSSSAMPSILLLGCNGQVGRELQRSLRALGPLLPLARRAHLDYRGADLADLDGLRNLVHKIKPSVIVNAAAYIQVDRAEADADTAHTINAVAPGVLAEAAHEIGALLVHYSTDYVFDGSGHTPWSEDAHPYPLSVYGQTKLEGEERVRAACERHLIFRCSWVYAAHGRNFIRTLLHLAQERERLTIVDDQIGAPTGVDLIADATAHAIRQALKNARCAGTYHLAASGETSRHGYARFVLDTVCELHPAWPLRVREVAPIPTSTYPTAAKRPLNSRLDTSRLRRTFGIRLPDWRIGVRRMLASQRMLLEQPLP